MTQQHNAVRTEPAQPAVLFTDRGLWWRRVGQYPPHATKFSADRSAGPVIEATAQLFPNARITVEEAS